MPRYVVLHHRLSPGKSLPRGASAHFDWMFEVGDALLTWATEEYTVEEAAMTALRLPEHRPAYLVYEGPIAGDRGEVTRVESGHYERLATSEQGTDKQSDGGMQSDDCYEFRVKGSQRNGVICFQRIVDVLNGGASGDRWSWSFRGMRTDAS
jgi:hypothetical protein